MPKSARLSYYGIGCWLLCAQLGHAQTDTTILLPTIAVEARSLRDYLPGEYSEHADSAVLAQYSGQNLADLLSAQSGAYLKTYGLGSLATASVRGGSAAQTAVIWNGVPIQSPMVGVVDFSLLPVFVADDIRLSYGTAGAQWGSGAVGGALYLNNTPPKKGWSGQFGAQAGSFGRWGQQAGLGWANSRFAAQGRWGQQAADNNFPFTPAVDLPIQKQVNAAAQQMAFLQDIYWMPSARTKLEAHFWLQGTTRQLPPTIVQTRSEARQDDTQWRAVVSGQFSLNKQLFQAKTAYSKEDILYVDPLTKTDAPSGFTQLFLEITDQITINRRWHAQLGANHTRYRAAANGYPDTLTEQRSALFGHLRYEGKKLQTQIGLRQEWQDVQAVPFMPSWGWQYQIGKPWQIQGKLARHYRLPTLNDRFWRPGGNENLQPEQGWGAEMGTAIKLGTALQYSATAFYRLIQDWVLWSQLEGQPYWSANNITTVESRGLEQRVRGSCTWHQQHFAYSLGYDLIRSVNTVAVTRPVMPAGQQLLYTPQQRGFARLTYGVGAWSAVLGGQYTGKVRGINEDIPGFFTADIQLGTHRRIQGLILKAHVKAENLLNERYFVIERRPMPGRSYGVGISANF